MGRPACSSCCKPGGSVPSKEGCKNEHFNVFYRVPIAGGWMPSTKYAQYILDQYNGGAVNSDPEDWRAGFSSMTDIIYYCSKPDYGEYQSSVNCWNYPALFLPNHLLLASPDDINEEFQAGGEDIGLHVPKRWNIFFGSHGVGGGKNVNHKFDSWISIYRELSGTDTIDEYYAGREFGFPDGPNAYNYTDGGDCYSTHSIGDPVLKIPDKGAWSGYLGEIEDMGCPVEGRHPGIDGPDGPCITSVQVKVTSHLVKWCTRIAVKEKNEAIESYATIKYNESDCFVWKREFTLLNQGQPISNIHTQERNLLEFDGDRYTLIDQNFSADGDDSSTSTRPDPLEDYTNFDFCLTYPFFSFDNFTAIFNPWPLGDIRPVVRAGNPPNVNDPWPKGTIPRTNIGGPSPGMGYHADKDFFQTLAVMTQRSCIVFNPYNHSAKSKVNDSSNKGIGRKVTEEEYLNYDSLLPIQGEPAIDKIEDLLPAPIGETQQEKIIRDAENLKRIQENLRLQESKALSMPEKPLVSPARSGKVETPYFQWTDNKINNKDDLTQYIISEDEPIKILPPYDEFPQIPSLRYLSGDPNWLPQQKLKSMSAFSTIMEEPEQGDDVDEERTGWAPHCNAGYYENSEDETGFRHEGDFGGGKCIPIGIIFVQIRSNRSADKSGLDIEVGMEVYYPVGSCDRYEIVQVRNGPRQTPVSVRIVGVESGARKLVRVSEVELVTDVLQYAMNYRTYLLQLIYLKNLDGQDDYYNPFKYRVTRIDVINPSIDHSYLVELMTKRGFRTVWDEIAGSPPANSPAMNMGQPDVFPTVPPEENCSDLNKSRLCQPYQIAHPTSHSDNAVYIEITKGVPWSGDDGFKLFQNRCEVDGSITLEPFDLADKFRPPVISDDVVITGPAIFEFQPDTVAVPVSEQMFSHIDTFLPEKESWMTHFEENETETIIGLKNAVSFKYKQLPNSSNDPNSPAANGYFFGGWLNLRFHLEKVSEWLQK